MSALRLLLLCAALAAGAAEAAAQGHAIAAGIARTPQLEARLKTMLPDGMTMAEAADGFRNSGQFIAALEASKRHRIDFAELKGAMTGRRALSLDRAVEKLKPRPRASR